MGGSQQQALRHICRTSCLSLIAACSFFWLDCEVEVEEMHKSAPPWWYDASGAYIRGVKPANASVPVALRRSVTLGVDGVLGQGTVFTDAPCTTSAAPPQQALLFLIVLLVVFWY
jgi:hypothetical protein